MGYANSPQYSNKDKQISKLKVVVSSLKNEIIKENPHITSKLKIYKILVIQVKMAMTSILKLNKMLY